VQDFSSKKQDKLNEINVNIQKKIDEKMKKVQDSTNLIKKLELQKMKDNENKKIERFQMFYSQTQKKKEIIDEKRFKDKKKFDHVRENYEDMQRDYDKKKLALSNKLKKKKQSKIMEIMNRKLDVYVNKRQSSYDRFLENYRDIKSNNTRRNIDLMRVQQLRNSRSVEKAKSVDISKDNIR